MGKPFAREIEQVFDTLTWGLNQNLDGFKEGILNNPKPLFVIGSGGSLSACYYAVLLFQQYGIMAKAITPLELYYSKSALKEANVLFISASGKNNDILFGYKTAVFHEPKSLTSICMRKNTPLAKLNADNSLGKHYEFDLPSGKDGFLATNSLVAFFSILYKGFENKILPSQWNVNADNNFSDSLKEFISLINADFTFAILYGGWGQPVAMDIESKMAEAALGDVLISDIRNFGHGRHHWLAKRGNSSAIVALITPSEEGITEKTLSFLPKNVPVLKIQTSFTDGLASIDLLIKSFSFINELGRIQRIDPGKPGVPEFGRKLYNLRYSSFYRLKDTAKERIAVVRKAKVATYDHLSDEKKRYWSQAYRTFKKRLESVVFGSVIFDYDGTICSSDDRYNKNLSGVISQQLVQLLDNGAIIGIATGRGISVRDALRNFIPKSYWAKVIVGYYNGSDIALLCEDSVPDKTKPNDTSLQRVFDLITAYKFPVTVTPTIRPHQVTIEIRNKGDWANIREIIIQLVMSQNLGDIQILESSHSIDIINPNMTSKQNVIETCSSLAKKNNRPELSLCIGDRGQWPGNDFQLLSSDYSLSVDEVSSIKDNCWNLSPAGIANVKATEYYLSKITTNHHGLKITL